MSRELFDLYPARQPSPRVQCLVGALPPGRCHWGSARWNRITSSSRFPRGKLPCGKQAQAGNRGWKEKGEPGPPMKMIIRDLDLCKDDIL